MTTFDRLLEIAKYYNQDIPVIVTTDDGQSGLLILVETVDYYILINNKIIKKYIGEIEMSNIDYNVRSLLYSERLNLYKQRAIPIKTEYNKIKLNIKETALKIYK